MKPDELLNTGFLAIVGLARKSTIRRPDERQDKAHGRYLRPDGTEVSYETAAKWDIAGIVKRQDGTWWLAAHGCSYGSVRQRTITHYNRHARLVEYSVSFLYEGTVKVVRDYFGHHRLTIGSVFFPGRGWEPQNLNAGRANLRKLAKDGATAVAIKEMGTNRIADFQMDELLKSMKSRKVS